jgi:two-component system phosphate regulon response regulator PhoB
MPLEQQRILVVDDNQILRTLLTQVLEAAGYIAIAAESAEAALEVLRFQPPDLCLVDQVMPGMSGADLIRTLRASPDERLRGIPAIALTGLAGTEGEMIAAGAVAAIRKPCAEKPLLDGVREALEG